jgi:alpha-tubulin suppressor-like RCC1 family protein
MAHGASGLKLKWRAGILLVLMLWPPLAVFAASAPRITTQPQSQNVFPGNSAAFTVAASGSPAPSYQWFFNGTKLTDSTRISGATQTTLTIDNVTVDDAGDYYVVVHNNHGSVTSSNASLGVVSVVAWGDNSYGQSSVPLSLTNAVSVAAGFLHSLALRADGTVVAWGDDEYGQTNVPAGLSNVVAISAGYYFSTALRADGTVVCWGWDNEGETNVPAGLSNVIAIASQAYHSLALKADGTLVQWGYYNGLGMLPPPLNLSNLVQTAPGGEMTLAFEADGTTVSWGGNIYYPAPDFSGVSNVVAVAAGDNHSVVLRSDGTVLATGANDWGQTNVVADATNLIAINAGVDDTLALKADGTLTGWGMDGSGQATPPPGLSNVVAMAAGGFHSLALIGSGPPRMLNRLPPSLRLPKNGVAYLNALATGHWPLHYQWQFNGSPLTGKTNNLLVLPNLTATNAGNYALVVTNSFGAVTSAVTALTVILPPVIDSQPQDQAAVLNHPAAFAVSVDSTAPFNCQWYFDGAPLADDGRIIGSTTTNLVIASVEAGDAGTYMAVVTNVAGGTASSNATLTVLLPAAIAVQPLDQSAPLNSNATFAVTATGDPPLSYQWYFDDAPLVDGANVSGSTTSELTLTGLQLTNAGAYSVVVTNLYGSAASSNAALTVTVPPGEWVRWDTNSGGNGHWYQAVITSNLDWLQADQIAHDQGGYLATITSAAENDFVFNLINDPRFYNGSGGNGAGPALGGVRTNASSAADLDWTWETGEPWNFTAWGPGQPDYPSETRLQFWSGVQGHPAPTWNNLTPTDVNLGGYIIEREDQPSILYQPSGGIVAAGTNITLAVVALGTPTLNYQWRFNGTNLDGATNASLTLTDVQPAQSGNHSVQVVNAFGTAVSSNALLVILIPPAISQPPANVTVIVGANAAFNAAVTGDPPLGYQWYFNGAPLADGSRITGSGTTNLTISNVQTPDAGNYTLLVTNPVGSASAVATLIVRVPPSVTTQPIGRSTPLALSTTFNAAASGDAPLTYQRQLNGTNIPGATNTSYTIAAVETNDLGVYQFVVSNAVGVAASSNAWLTVGPVAAWGYNYYNQCLVPPGLSNVTTVAGGYYYSLASLLDGSIAAWGGVGQSTNSTFTNVVALSANANGVLALRSDGSVTGSGPVSPLAAKVFPTNSIAVAAGGSFGLALRAEGTVMSWGPYSSGTYYYSAPVPPGLTQVTAIAAGYQHALALKQDGTVVAWGYGPATNVPAGLGNVVAIAAGSTHSLALKSDGTVVAWGWGAGTNVPAGLSNVVAIAAGGYPDQRSSVSFAVQSNGTVVAWGLSPYNLTNAPSGLSNVVTIALGSYHALALVNDGKPQILRQPVGGTAWSGSDWTLRVAAAGAAPLNYQWLFDGTNLDDATNSTLLLPAIQSSNAGNYQVVVSNSLGVATSVAVPLAVMDSAPFWLTQSATNLAGWLGNPFRLAAAAAGSGPLQYQWRFNGTDIPGATNDSLDFPRLHLADAGNYIFAASNSFGAVTSAVIHLAVQQVLVWGDGSYGQTNVPSGLTNAVAISAGLNGNIALRADGTVAVWGDSGYVSTNTAGVSNVVEVSAGQNSYLAMEAGGRPIVWGSVPLAESNILAAQSNVISAIFWDSRAELLRADGTVVQISVNGILTNNAVTNGIVLENYDNNYLVLRADGTVYSSLGNVPPNFFTNVCSLGASESGNQITALRRDGTVKEFPLTLLSTNVSHVIGVASAGYSPLDFAVLSDGSVVYGVPAGYPPPDPATNVPVGLTGVQALDAGYRHCLALLSDRDFPPFLLPVALNTTNFVVSSKGSPQWFGETNVSHDGVSAAQSAAIGNNTASSMRTWVAGAVTVKFWWKVSSATNHGVLSFSAGGVVLTNISGEVDWQPCAVTVAQGNEILQWTYSKDGAAAAGQDAGWVDQLQIVPVPPQILAQPQPSSQEVVGGTNLNVSYSVAALGTPPLNFSWRRDGGAILTGPFTNLTLTGVSRADSGTYSVEVISPYGSATSSNAVLLVHVPQLLGTPVLQPDGSIVLTTTDADGGQLSATDLTNCQVQVSTNLVDWTTLSNALVLTNGTVQLQDAGASNAPTRFYRILENW